MQIISTQCKVMNGHRSEKISYTVHTTRHLPDRTTHAAQRSRGQCLARPVVGRKAKNEPAPIRDPSLLGHTSKWQSQGRHIALNTQVSQSVARRIVVHCKDSNDFHQSWRIDCSSYAEAAGPLMPVFCGHKGGRTQIEADLARCFDGLPALLRLRCQGPR